MSTVLDQDVQTPSTSDFLPLNGADYIEFYVGNARQASYFYRMAMGMRWTAYAGPENGRPDRTSFVLQQGKIRFVLTTPLRPDNEIAAHIHLHGDGVRDVALWVDDVRYAWKETTRRGARSVREPIEIEDANGLVKMASIATYGDTIHTFVERHDYKGPFLPGYQAVAHDSLARSTGLDHVDRMVGNVGWQEMRRWANFYSDVMGFALCEDLDSIDGEPSALMSKAMAKGGGRVEFPIREPAEGREKSEVEEYLEYYHGSGVQRIALATADIFYTIAKMREQGMEFIQAPRSYYAGLESRVGRLDEPVSELERLGILVDRDTTSYKLYCLTRPVEDRPTLLFEIVQRKNPGLSPQRRGSFLTSS